MDNNIGFKELYEVSLKATYSIELEGRTFEPGETIAVFDKIMLGTLDENRSRSSSTGGYDNRSLIWWEETKEVKLRLTQGIFSKRMLSLMTNASLISQTNEKSVRINQRENVETDERGWATLKRSCAVAPFVYDAKTGEKITEFSWTKDTIIINQPYRELLVDYWFDYASDSSILTVGRALTNGYLSLTGKTRVKDEITGQVKTGIINIPKLKLMSDLSIRLGSDAVPQVGRLDAIAVPDGQRGNKKVMELIFLSDDIDSDM